jgi:hypothetical protein
MYSVVSLSVVQNPPKSASDTVVQRGYGSICLTYNTIRFLYQLSNKSTPFLPTTKASMLTLPGIGNISTTHQTVQTSRTALPGEHVRANPKSCPTLKNTCLRLLLPQRPLACIPHLWEQNI